MRISKKILALILVVVLLVGVGVAVYLSQQQQDVRQRAAEPSPTVCVADQPTDTMLIFDKSGSMRSPTSTTDTTTRLESARNAASKFIDILAKRTQTPLHEVSLSTISTDTLVKVEQALTSDLTKIKTALSAINYEGGTCIECGLDAAIKDFAPNQRDGIKNVAVMLTDGGATQFIGGKPSSDVANQAEAQQRALDKAISIHNTYDVTFYTIGFGTDAKDQLLTNIATYSGGLYFFAPDAATLDAIYTKIAQIIGKGSISGSKYYDVNQNGVFDEDEVKINNWQLNLYSDTGDTPIQTTKTDAEGNYIFTGLCDGSYIVKEDSVTDWVATDNQTEQVVTIANAQNQTDVNFGNSQESTPNACAVTQGSCQWDPVTGAISYTVEVKESAADSEDSKTIFGPSSVDAPQTKVVFTAQPGKTYTCSVSATNSCSTGPSASAQASCPLPSTSPSPSPSPSPSASPSPSPSTSPSPSPTVPTVSPTISLTPSASPTVTVTTTPGTTVTPTATTPSPTTISNTPTATVATSTPTSGTTITPTPTIESPGSIAQTITIVGGILLTIIGALFLFAL
ncbi:MAG: VWA domain-containing protein [Candidatus Levybacteria bacterium]|nr:VWA domain-containing protein [Candidatus Levybacteria bacterium]